MNPAKAVLLALILSGFYYGNASAQKEVQVNSNSVTKNSGIYNPFPEEMTVYINPVNPQNIIGGANLDWYYYSFDGGKSWKEGRLPGPIVRGDPVVHFDMQGNAYYTHLGDFTNTGIYIAKSTDGGRTWGESRRIYGNNKGAPFHDKQWIASDTSGNLFVSWTQFDKYESENPRDSSRIIFSSSTNRGETFSQPIIISDISGDCRDGDSTVEGAVPCVASNGDIYAAWSVYDTIYFDKSTDGGKTWGKDIKVCEQVNGWAYNIPGIYRCNGLPFTDTDVSGLQYDGAVYVNFSDDRNGDHDVFVVKSTDGGNTWGQPVRVNDDKTGNGKEQFMSHFSVDKKTGNIYVLFYDRRNHDDESTDVYLARSTDGGATFTNYKISSSPFTPDPELFFGDYIGVNSYNDMVVCMWMRADGEKLKAVSYTKQF